MSELEARLADIVAMRKKIDELKDGLKEPFVKAIQEKMATVPGLTGVRFTMYTPYFNDGDECIFRSNHDDAEYLFSDRASPEEPDDEEAAFEGNFLTSTYGPYVEKRDKDPRAQACLPIQALLDSLGDEDYRGMFGNHVEVTIRPGAVEVSEYCHD
jgi:hypothetical protein